MSHLQATLNALSNQFARAVTEALMASLSATVSEVEPSVGVSAAPKGAKTASPKARSKKAAPAKPQQKAANSKVAAKAGRAGAGAKKTSVLDRLPTRSPVSASKAQPERTKPKGGAGSKVGPVLRGSLASPETQGRLASILAVLANGPLYSEDLRRLVNLPRPALAKPLLLGLKTQQITKSGDRRKTIYQLA